MKHISTLLLIGFLLAAGQGNGLIAYAQTVPAGCALSGPVYGDIDNPDTQTFGTVPVQLYAYGSARIWVRITQPTTQDVELFTYPDSPFYQNGTTGLFYTDTPGSQFLYCSIPVPTRQPVDSCENWTLSTGESRVFTLEPGDTITVTPNDPSPPSVYATLNSASSNIFQWLNNASSYLFSLLDGGSYTLSVSANVTVQICRSGGGGSGFGGDTPTPTATATATPTGMTDYGVCAGLLPSPPTGTTWVEIYSTNARLYNNSGVGGYSHFAVATYAVAPVGATGWRMCVRNNPYYGSTRGIVAQELPVGSVMSSFAALNVAIQWSGEPLSFSNGFTTGSGQRALAISTYQDGSTHLGSMEVWASVPIATPTPTATRTPTATTGSTNTPTATPTLVAGCSRYTSAGGTLSIPLRTYTNISHSLIIESTSTSQFEISFGSNLGSGYANLRYYMYPGTYGTTITGPGSFSALVCSLAGTPTATRTPTATLGSPTATRTATTTSTPTATGTATPTPTAGIPGCVGSIATIPASPGVTSLSFEQNQQFIVADATVEITVISRTLTLAPQFGPYQWNLSTGTYQVSAISVSARILFCEVSSQPDLTPTYQACDCVIVTAIIAPSAIRGSLPELGIAIPTIRPQATITATLTISATVIVRAIQTMQASIATPAAAIQTSVSSYDWAAGEATSSDWTTQAQPVFEWFAVLNPDSAAWTATGGPLWALAPLLLPVLPIIGIGLVVVAIRVFLWFLAWLLKLIDIVFKLIEVIPGE